MAVRAPHIMLAAGTAIAAIGAVRAAHADGLDSTSVAAIGGGIALAAAGALMLWNGRHAHVRQLSDIRIQGQPLDRLLAETPRFGFEGTGTLSKRTIVAETEAAARLLGEHREGTQRVLRGMLRPFDEYSDVARIRGISLASSTPQVVASQIADMHPQLATYGPKQLRQVAGEVQEAARASAAGTAMFNRERMILRFGDTLADAMRGVSRSRQGIADAIVDSSHEMYHAVRGIAGPRDVLEGAAASFGARRAPDVARAMGLEQVVPAISRSVVGYDERRQLLARALEAIGRPIDDLATERWFNRAALADLEPLAAAYRRLAKA